MTTAQLRRDLDEIDYLLAALRTASPTRRDELDDMAWLQGRRRYVLTVLASRKAMQNRKVVSLDQWRDGGVSQLNVAVSAA